MENKTLYNASTKLTSERQKDTEQLNKNIRGHQSLASESNKSQFEPVGVNHWAERKTGSQNTVFRAPLHRCGSVMTEGHFGSSGKHLFWSICGKRNGSSSILLRHTAVWAFELLNSSFNYFKCKQCIWCLFVSMLILLKEGRKTSI